MAAALETPNFPHIVGRYVLYGAIASGGMATVHFGRLVGPAGFARPVAIKRLHAQFARDPDFVQMFLDEARLAARISHPNVVQTLDLVEAGDEIFLVMDYVRGLALSTLVRSLRATGTRIPPAISVGIAVGVLEGLHAAHEAKDDMGERLDLVHRDVSPQNVLVGTDGIPRLLDFGIAKAGGRRGQSSTQSGKVKGKIAYMAPEQIHSQPLTRRTDIYGASVLLWEILTGRRLFFGDNDADSLRRAMNDEVQPPSSIIPDLPKELDRVVMKGLDRNASKRYATAHDMAVDLGACFTAAPSAEIGQWVERTAAQELNQRASLIAAIERSAAESMSQVSLAPQPGAGAPDAPTPVGKRLHDIATEVRVDVDLSESGETGLRAVTWTGPRESGSRRRVVLAAAASVLAIVTVLVFVLRARSIPPSPAAAPPSASVAATPPPAPATPPPPTVSVTSLPAAPMDSASSTVAADHPPVPAPTSSKSTGHHHSSSPSDADKGSSSGGSKPGCDPPYTEDAQGHIHFKPSCM